MGYYEKNLPSPTDKRAVTLHSSCCGMHEQRDAFAKRNDNHIARIPAWKDDMEAYIACDRNRHE